MTNRDKINKMTSEEFAEALTSFVMGAVYSPSRDKTKSINKQIADWLDTEIKQTADEMLEELGYKASKEYETPITILYDNAEIRQIIIDKVSLCYGKRTKYNAPMLISEAEDKAIHKKIEELKNGKRRY